jgi:hypothetical protein
MLPKHRALLRKVARCKALHPLPRAAGVAQYGESAAQRGDHRDEHSHACPASLSFANLDPVLERIEKLGLEVVREPAADDDFGFRSVFVRGPDKVRSSSSWSKRRRCGTGERSQPPLGVARGQLGAPRACSGSSRRTWSGLPRQ